LVLDIPTKEFESGFLVARSLVHIVYKKVVDGLLRRIAYVIDLGS
jgi:hypothetical protein